MSVETERVDILLYVALQEEFGVLRKALGDGFQPKELTDIALTVFLGDIFSPALQRKFRVGVVPAGKMGNTRAATVVSATLAKLPPSDVVVLGIAGSLAGELEPGDVFIPGSINEYLANSASTGEGPSWSLRTSGNEFQTSPRLLNRFQMFEHTKADDYAKWLEDTRKNRRDLIDADIATKLRKKKVLLREDCRLYAGDDRKLVSGPTVGKSKPFVEWITQQVDRKAFAMEMESAGVHDAAIVRTPAPRAMAIRGISDYADFRKTKIESAAKDRLRTLAALNALSLLIRGIESGLFEPESGAVLQLPAESQQGARIVESRVKSVFVIGGVTAETSDKDGEQPRLYNASLKLGHVLARAGAQLIICSPFPDSADYYVAMGYADEDCPKRVIHLHSPKHEKVAHKRQLLGQALQQPGQRHGLTIQDWSYPGPESEESWPQAWLLAQLQALERAEAVVALGGRVSNTANTLLHLAEVRGIPIVPFAFLSGAARRAYARRDWQRLNAGLDASVMNQDAGVEHAIEIANRLVVDRVARSFGDLRDPKAFFVSYARQDVSYAIAATSVLQSRGLEVMTGDGQVRDDQMISASIEQSLLKSDVCMVLWSRSYAVSPWCYDEFEIAAERSARGQMRIWLFNLDDSLVVPRWARGIAMISVRSPAAIVSAINSLLSGDGQKDITLAGKAANPTSTRAATLQPPARAQS